MKNTIRVALAALAITYLFFVEYLPPFAKVHIPYDLDGFHYPLMDYGFQALKQGRLPQWDSTYSGISYAGNPQTALFYPPTWLMFAANWGREHLSYMSLQWFAIAHVWLGFMLAYLWMRRGKGLGEPASLVGAGVFAFSGFACNQLQHLGLTAVYAWTPLVLLGIDEAAERGRIYPLWKVAAGSALAFLAGYTPSWFVLAVFASVYAICRGWRTGAATIAAIGVSLGIAMVQLLPAYILTATKIPDNRYGGIMPAGFFLSYFIPNFYDFGMDVPAGTNFPNEYCYLGAAGLFGLACATRSKRRPLLPILGALAVCFVLFLNPFNLIAPVIEQLPLLRQVCRAFYFSAGITVAAAALAAHGFEEFGSSGGGVKGLGDHRLKPVPRLLTLVVSIGWTGWQLWRWRSSQFPHSWQGAIEPALTLALFAWIAIAWRRHRTQWLFAALILTALVDYKTFGTSKRFNASPGQYKPIYTATTYPAMDDEAFQEMRRHPEYRVLADIYLNPLHLRHAGLSTPQGFDPFLPRVYESMLQKNGAEFRSNWEFGIPPENTALLNTLGVRYWITAEGSELYPKLAAIPRFRELGREKRYYRVFEDTAASSAVRVAGTVRIDSWTPERRVLRTIAQTAAPLSLAENNLPGWTALVDGQEQPIASGDSGFLKISIPAGEHRVEFAYRTAGLAAGAWISLISAIALATAAFIQRGPFP